MERSLYTERVTAFEIAGVRGNGSEQGSRGYSGRLSVMDGQVQCINVSRKILDSTYNIRDSSYS